MALVGASALLGSGRAIADIGMSSAASTAVNSANMVAKVSKKGEEDALAIWG